MGVDGKVYLAGRNGTTVVLEDSDTLKVLAVNRLDDPIDASPALSGDAIYICLLYTSPSPRDATLSRMPSSA